jgi:hypothetical protein
MKWILQLQSEKIIKFNNKEYKLHNGERYFNRGNKKCTGLFGNFITVKKKRFSYTPYK